MTYKIDNLFPTQLYCSTVSDVDFINSTIDRCIDKIDFRMNDTWGPTHYLSTSDFEDDIISEHGLEELSKEIYKHLTAYCKEVGFTFETYNIKSWFTRTERGNYAHIHNHGLADISGVYYYKTNGKDGKIFFESPNPHFDTSRCYFWKGYRREYDPEEGHILLFPSWLRHGVETNQTDDARISLSFNIKFKGFGLE